MNAEWLTAESFERNHEVISAINTLSIHAKLLMAGAKSTPMAGEVSGARQRLQDFLGHVSTLMRDIEEDQEAPVLGADPRLGLLVREFATTKHRWPPSSLIYTLPMEEVEALVNSDRPEDREKLVECLGALRQLVEQHAHADVVNLLGQL